MKAVVLLGGFIVALPVILQWMDLILRLIEMIGRFWRLLARISSWIFGSGKAIRRQDIGCQCRRHSGY